MVSCGGSGRLYGGFGESPKKGMNDDQQRKKRKEECHDLRIPEWKEHGHLFSAGPQGRALFGSHLTATCLDKLYWNSCRKADMRCDSSNHRFHSRGVAP